MYEWLCNITTKNDNKSIFFVPNECSYTFDAVVNNVKHSKTMRIEIANLKLATQLFPEIKLTNHKE